MTEDLAHVRASDLQRLFKFLLIATQQLGPNTPVRQIMVLLSIALANKAAVPIGVTDLDDALGGLKSGSASKLLRSMMHIETERKPGVANTVTAERDPRDLRRYNLSLTQKGTVALAEMMKPFEAAER